MAAASGRAGTASAIAGDTAYSRQFVSKQKPVLQGIVHRPNDRTTPSGRNVGQDCIPRRSAVVSFHLTMGFGKSEMFYSHAVVFDQRMFFERCRRWFRS